MPSPPPQAPRASDTPDAPRTPGEGDAPLTPAPARGQALARRLNWEWKQLSAIQPSQRPWALPVAAALALGLPVLLGAQFGRLDLGLVASLGGLAFLYLPETPLHHRMAAVMLAGFGLAACYALGMLTQALAVATVPLLTLIAVLVGMACRYARVRPPASLFFVMAAALGAYSPAPLSQWPQMVGLVFLGGLLASLIGFVYSLVRLRQQAPQAVEALPAADFDHVVVDAVLIGGFVGLSLALAEALRLERPYWVPVSCMAVIQGASLRAVWNRHLQRVAGTALGLLLAAGLLALPLNPWTVALLVMLLSLLIETLIVRHYGLATVFITPLTILLAEAATLGSGASPAALMQSRFYDTVLGCVVGLLGGLVLHQPRLRALVARPLKALVPARLR